MALVLSSALWRSTFYYLLLYDVDMNGFCRLDYDFYDVTKFYFPDTDRGIVQSWALLEKLALRGFVNHKVTLCRGKLKQHDNHEFFDWLPTFLPSTESLGLGRIERYVPDDNLVYGPLTAIVWDLSGEYHFMLGTPRIHVHSMIVFLWGFSVLSRFLSCPVKTRFCSLLITKWARWEHLHRDGPPGIYRVSTLLRW